MLFHHVGCSRGNGGTWQSGKHVTSGPWTNCPLESREVVRDVGDGVTIHVTTLRRAPTSLALVATQRLLSYRYYLITFQRELVTMFVLLPTKIKRALGLFVQLGAVALVCWSCRCNLFGPLDRSPGNESKRRENVESDIVVSRLCVWPHVFPSPSKALPRSS